ncbi:hypothetical protein C3747_190g3 [Trypanosoma cruzi]|uniref:Uncharacterized protein n=1 Tax=Trypanosoma cruzi TaxID=5693 RepID=A0A2V2W361_TRYCR|nr:hypothetical protein C3747_190g3 [Trypanosoma cruzi]
MMWIHCLASCIFRSAISALPTADCRHCLTAIIPDTYTSDDGVLLATTNITAAGDPMTFLVAVYDWRGNLKGLRHVSEVLNLCCISDADMSSFFKVGSNRRLRCFFDWYKLLQDAGPTYFFELFNEGFHEHIPPCAGPCCDGLHHWQHPSPKPTRWDVTACHGNWLPTTILPV